jgi:hypothetical protein
LHPEIKAMLPDGVENWFLLPKRNPEQDALIETWWRTGSTPYGVVAEYTLNSRKGKKSYLSDPDLRLVRAATFVTAVVLRTSPQRFSDQFRHLASPGWRRVLRSRKWLDDQTQIIRFWAKLYSQPGWLDEIYECWEDYLTLLLRQGLTVQLVRLEPDGEIGRNFRWRLYPFQNGAS